MLNIRRFSVLIVFVLVACGGGTGTQPRDAAQPAQTFTVQVDGSTDAFSGAFGAFFPDHVAVHAGDTVIVRLRTFSGQPHTPVLGTLVDAAVAKLNRLGPQASLAVQENSPEMLHLPDAYPHQITGGPQDANQSAGQPCYLDSGIPPLSLTGGAPPCPRRDKPEFNGTQSFYNGGVLLRDGDSFAVPISKSTRPGTYGLMCLSHRSAGTAQITVAPPEQSVPSPDQVAASGRQQLQHLVDLLKPVAATAAQATADNAVAGAVDPNVVSSEVAQFGPTSLTVPVGGTVTWHLNVFHTISFGAQPTDVGSLVRSADGTVHLNEKGNLPAGFQVPEAAFAYPPPDDGRPIVIDGGRWDGMGFRSTGLLGSLPPVLITVKQTFTKAGTYPYRCLFHPHMQGVVVVS